jgi:hypothetical protein
MNTETTQTTDAPAPSRRIGRPPKLIRGEPVFLPRTFCIDDELLAAIDARAQAERMSRSELARKACREYLRRIAKREERAEQ